LSENAKFVT